MQIHQPDIPVDPNFPAKVSSAYFVPGICHDLLGETIIIIFAELTRFLKSEDECVTLQDRLLYLLKHSGTMTRPPKWVAEGNCHKLLDALLIGDFDAEKRHQYDKDMNDERKLYGQLAAARDQGIDIGREQGIDIGREEGINIGREQGIDIGREQGIDIGREEGLIEGVEKTIRRMIASGLSVEQVCSIVEMSVEEVEAIAARQ